mgnify:CR=1 FL=1
MTFGRVNPNSRLEGQKIAGLGNVYYNYLEFDLLEFSFCSRTNRTN